MIPLLVSFRLRHFPLSRFCSHCVVQTLTNYDFFKRFYKILVWFKSSVVAHNIPQLDNLHCSMGLRIDCLVTKKSHKKHVDVVENFVFFHHVFDIVRPQ